MARLFLSYSREDAARAKALAKALEGAGHEVWWDRHIHGGSRFAREIEAALKQCDVVVVLWSRSSTESAWVQDEAAAGRDTNRLVPVLIEDVEAPLGFRQYQSIDLSGWTARRKIPAALLTAISAKCLDDSVKKDDSHGNDGKPRNQRSPFRLIVAAIGLILAAALVVGGWRYVSSDFTAAAETPTLAVLPFADLSPQKDKAYFAEGVAEEILSTLAKLESINVVGRTSSWQFKDRGSDMKAIRAALDATHVLEGSVRSDGTRLKMTVRLLSTRDSKEIWSEQYDRQLKNIFAVQEEIGRAVANRLQAALIKFPASTGREANTDVYALLLQARAKLRQRQQAPIEEARRLAQRAIALDPGYAAAYAVLSEGTSLLANTGGAHGDIPFEEAKRQAVQYAQKAIQLAPNLADGYAALAIPHFQRSGPEGALRAIPFLERAASLDPARGEIRYWLGLANGYAGRSDKALQHHRLAYEKEPLWATAVARYVGFLSANGRAAEAAEVIGRFEAGSRDRAEVARIKAVVALEQGQLSEAIRFASLAWRLNPNLYQNNHNLGRAYHALGMQREAAQAIEARRAIRKLHYAGDSKAAAEKAIGLGPALDHDADSELALSLLARERQWTHLLQLYKQWFNSPNDLCRRRPGYAVPLAAALVQSGRKDVAGQVLECTDKWIAHLRTSGVYAPDQSRSALDFREASVAALRGQKGRALMLLSRAVKGTWRGQNGLSSRLDDYPAFDTLRSSSEFINVERELSLSLQREREKLRRW